MVKKINLLAAVLVVAVALTACGPRLGEDGASAAGRAEGGVIQINGAGATFPYPIYSKWFDIYSRNHPNVQINYQSIGSGGGIRQLANRTVFFGATDGPMTEEQLAAAPGTILHFPTVLGGVVPVYNVEGVDATINFPPDVLADIFMAKIGKWNDPRIAAANPGVNLPNQDILVLHRSDGSGTTYIWTDYLSKVSPEFKGKVGVGTSVRWPQGVGAKGNEGVAGMVRQTPGAVGYVELIYAKQNDIPYGAVRNAAGNYVLASVESLTAAAASAIETMPEDFRVSITNAPGGDAYPVASFTWLLMYEEPEDEQKARVMVDFVRWALTDGQKYAAEMGYAPLPPAVVERVLAQLDRIRLQESQ